MAISIMLRVTDEMVHSSHYCHQLQGRNQVGPVGARDRTPFSFFVFFKDGLSQTFTLSITQDFHSQQHSRAKPLTPTLLISHFSPIHIAMHSRLFAMILTW